MPGMKTDAQKVQDLRKKAEDKSLPQDVRNTFLDRANQIEQEAAKKAGVKLAKGGMLPVRGSRAAPHMAKKVMAKGGAVAKKAKK